MAQEQSIEAARARIQRLVDEIAALSKRDVRTEEYLQQFLVRAVQASDAKGGAVWLVGQRSADGKHEFQLAAAVEFESSLFQSDEEQRATILGALAEVVQTRKAAILAPAHQETEPGSLQGQLGQIHAAPERPAPNKTPYPFLHVPLHLKEQVLGVLQVWLQPYVTAQNYNEFSVFLGSLATYVEQHFQSRRLGSLVLETQRLQHLLKFTGDLAGSLDPLEVARLAANYGRDVIGCDRCSVLARQGDRWRVLAISGQENVEKKSAMVKGMAAFVGAHAREEFVVLSKKELLARAEAGRNPRGPDSTNGESAQNAIALRATDEIDLAYFQLSHVISAAIAPLLDHEKQLIGAYFAESTVEGFFDPSPGAKELPAPARVTEWLAAHTGRSLQGAQDYKSLPFLSITRRLRDVKLRLMGPKRNRFLFKLALFLALAFGVSFYPKMDRVDANCSLLPVHRGAVVPEVPGRVEKVHVREGDHVVEGAEIAQLDTKRFETELEATRQEMRRLFAEAERYRGLGDEGSAQIAFLQASVAEQNEKKVKADLAATTLRSPIAGVVLTKDVELRTGEFIQAGSNFAEVAAFDAWELQVDVSEKEIGRVEEALPRAASGTGKDVTFILYSQSSHTLHARLERHEQISAAAYPREKENVFVVTLQNIAIPPAIQPAMRPGLTGRAKIDLGRKPLIWIVARKVWHWFELRLIG
jgi:biotin carboxyl carrier protein